MNVDAKTLSKILANRIPQYIENNYIAKMKEWFYIQKSMNVIHHVKTLKKKNHIIPVQESRIVVTRS